MRALLPMQVDPTIRLILKISQCITIDGVYDGALTTICDPDNAFTGHWLTATGAFMLLVGLKTNDCPLCFDLITLLFSQLGIDTADDLVGGNLG